MEVQGLNGTSDDQRSRTFSQGAKPLTLAAEVCGSFTQQQDAAPSRTSSSPVLALNPERTTTVV